MISVRRSFLTLAVIFCGFASVPSMPVLSVPSLNAAQAAAEPTVAGRTRTQWRDRLKNADDSERVQAAIALSQFKELPVDDLVAAASDKQSAVRYWAMRGLQRGTSVKSPPFERIIVTTLKQGLTDLSAAVRIEAAVGVARRGDVDLGLDLLVKELQNPVDGVRIQAVAGLEELGPIAQSRRAAIVSGQDDSSEYVKRISNRILSTWQTK